jgi:hypothetical protein
VSKELLVELEKRGLLDFGEVIPAAIVRDLLGLEYPTTATKKEFDALSLAELKAVDYVRNVLLGRGMYLAGQGGDYRILLPSENARQIELYISSADGKLSRALKLSRNTPKLADKKHTNDQTSARIIMKREGVRRGIGR